MLFNQETMHPAKRPRQRKKHQRSRIHAALKQMLEGNVHITLLGEDMLFLALLADHDGEPPTAAACQVLFKNIPITIVGIPDRIWISPVPLARLKRASTRMEELGRHCILLPQSAIRRIGHEAFDAPAPALHCAPSR